MNEKEEKKEGKEREDWLDRKRVKMTVEKIEIEENLWKLEKELEK